MAIQGVGAIAHTVINGCPELQFLFLVDSDTDDDYGDMASEMVDGMLHAAGREADVAVLQDYYG